MLVQIAIGTIAILVSIIVSCVLVATTHTLRYKFVISRIKNPIAELTVSLLGATFTMVIVITFITWLWALLLIWLGTFNNLEPALYFSLISFTTLGFGDLILNEDWRLLAGFIAANGFIVFGLGTAYILETLMDYIRR